MKKILLQIPGFNVPKYLNWKLSSLLKFLFLNAFNYRPLNNFIPKSSVDMHRISETNYEAGVYIQH